MVQPIPADDEVLAGAIGEQSTDLALRFAQVDQEQIASMRRAPRRRNIRSDVEDSSQTSGLAAAERKFIDLAITTEK